MPAQVPLAELLPEMLARAGETGAADRPAGGWMLRRGDGGSLVGETALANQGVRDGDVLYLVPRQLAWPEPAYDDVVEEIAAGARAHGRLWDPAATRLVALAGVALVLLIGLAALATAGSGRLLGPIAVLVAVALLGAGALVSRAFGDGPAGTVAGAGAAVYAAVGAVLIGPGVGGRGPDQLLLAGAALVLCSVVAVVAVGFGLRVFTAGVLIGLLAVTGAGAAFVARPAGAAAVMSFLLVAGVGLAPLVAVRVGGLPLPVVTAAPELIAAERRPERSDLRAAVVRTDEILAGLLLGLGVAGLGCVYLLAQTSGVAGRLLAVLTAGSLLLRARLFPAIAARLPLLAAGAAGLSVAAAGVLPGLGEGGRMAVSVVGLAALGGLLAVATAAGRQRGVTSPYVARWGDIADVALVVALAPVACVVAGLFEWVSGLVG